LRRFIDQVVPLITGTCALGACGVFALLVAAILTRGLPAISPGFLIEATEQAGVAGGILYQLIGTLILVATALLVSAPLATGVALVHQVFVRTERWRRRLTLVLYTLNGVPSILFGLVGLIVFVRFLGWGKSWLAGGVLLGLMILPTVAVALTERMSSLPQPYIEAAAGLGLSQVQIIWAVILPQSLQGLVTGSLLGLARAAGETAPILFTAAIFAGATVPNGIKDNPVLALPYHIFVLAQDSLAPEAGTRLGGRRWC
jgi:phosphate transport system permease protein